VILADAVLVIDKPSGLTSFDVVRAVRRATGVRRVGHGGTLDPLASGVLPICLGEATKLAQFLLAADKEYEVTVRLGVETDTDDADGAPTATHDAQSIGEAAVRQALGRFRGAIDQVPPVYSALKRDGKALYAHARAGAPVVPESRAVVVHALELTRFEGPAAVGLRVHCSKGTYIRSIARDLGRALGVGAHVTTLRRTRSGPFSLAEARPLPEVLLAISESRESDLPRVTLVSALRHLVQRTVGPELARDLRIGRRISWDALTAGAAETADTPVCVVDAAGELVTVAERGADALVRTIRVFGRGPQAGQESAGKKSAGRTCPTDGPTLTQGR
jgi:tRNA pseudouridine55 synthase